MNKLLSLFLVLVLALGSMDADARRMGGGKSMGRQSGNVTQREAARPPQTTNPSQTATGTAAAGGAATAAAGATARKPWGAMLGGIAAGLGLAWLAHSLGLGAGFGNVLLIAVLALAAFAVFRMLRNRASGSSGNTGGLAYQGAGVATAPNYNPAKVGNDASARPWERQTAAFDGSAAGNAATTTTTAAAGSMIGSALAGSQTWGIPSGFDADGFIAAAKRNFVTLQEAWDRSDVSTLHSMMTDAMVNEIRTQLAEREQAAGGQPNHTDVVKLEAQLLGIEELDNEYMASVEFNGLVREEQGAGPTPFREVWNMTKSKTGGGWLVAGVQALQ